MKEKLEEHLKILEEGTSLHVEIAKKIIKFYANPMNIYLITILRRSMSLMHGFALCIRAQNLMCAIPLVRFQLDNLLRLRAAFLTNDPDGLATEFFKGTPVRNMRDKHGNKMTDKYLQQALSTEYPWLKELYEKTSGYVHLSDKHFYNALVSLGLPDDTKMEMYIGPVDQIVESKIYEDAIGAMIYVTDELLMQIRKSIQATGKIESQ
jgi:hypothetical protein